MEPRPLIPQAPKSNVCKHYRGPKTGFKFAPIPAMCGRKLLCNLAQTDGEIAGKLRVDQAKFDTDDLFANTCSEDLQAIDEIACRGCTSLTCFCFFNSTECSVPPIRQAHTAGNWIRTEINSSMMEAHDYFVLSSFPVCNHGRLRLFLQSSPGSSHTPAARCC